MSTLEIRTGAYALEIESGAEVDPASELVRSLVRDLAKLDQAVSLSSLRAIQASTVGYLVSGVSPSFTVEVLATLFSSHLPE